jgi:lariat debranching enzyme
VGGVDAVIVNPNTGAALTSSSAVDVVLGHDWPRGIEHYGDTGALLRAKPAFESDVRSGALGNPASWELLARLRPRFWFGAHLHTKFSALVVHPERGAAGAQAPAAERRPSPSETTRFLCLDKCIPGRAYLQVLDVPWRPGEEDEEEAPFG